VRFNRRGFLTAWPRRAWPLRMVDRKRAERLRMFRKTVYEELYPNVQGARGKGDTGGVAGGAAAMPAFDPEWSRSRSDSDS
jgi:hypothetical protein